MLRRASGTPIPLQGYAAAGRHVALLQEYIADIQRVPSRQAGKLRPGEGEMTLAIGRRLAATAEALGKELQIRRSASAVYFWTPETPRRGRPGHVAPIALPRPNHAHVH